MTENKKTYLIYAVLIILTLIAGWFGVRLPAPPIPEPLPFEVEATRGGLGGIRIGQDVTIAQDLAVGGATTLTSATASGALTADDVTSVDDLVVGDDSTFGGYLTITATSVQTVTNGSTIAATTGYVPLAAAGAVGTSAITGCATAGRFTYLVNTVNQTITITDTGTLKLSGNIALGQFDSLTLIGDGTNCVQTATSNN